MPTIASIPNITPVKNGSNHSNTSAVTRLKKVEEGTDTIFKTSVDTVPVKLSLIIKECINGVFKFNIGMNELHTFQTHGWTNIKTIVQQGYKPYNQLLSRVNEDELFLNIMSEH